MSADGSPGVLGAGCRRLASGANPRQLWRDPTRRSWCSGDLATGTRRPALHLRATYAPDRPRQHELAAGAGVRPLARLPIRLMAEARATRTENQTEVRPALFAVTELAPVALPLGMRAEGYAQGGYVGGRYSPPRSSMARRASPATLPDARTSASCGWAAARGAGRRRAPSGSMSARRSRSTCAAGRSPRGCRARLPLPRRGRRRARQRACADAFGGFLAAAPSIAPPPSSGRAQRWTSTSPSRTCAVNGLVIVAARRADGHPVGHVRGRRRVPDHAAADLLRRSADGRRRLGREPGDRRERLGRARAHPPRRGRLPDGRGDWSRAA